MHFIITWQNWKLKYQIRYIQSRTWYKVHILDAEYILDIKSHTWYIHMIHCHFYYIFSFSILHPSFFILLSSYTFSVQFCLITLFVDNIFCVFFMLIFIYFHLLFSFLTSQFSLWTESTGSSTLIMKPNRFNRILLLQVVSSPFNIIVHLFTSIICLFTNPKTFYSCLNKSNRCHAFKYIHIKDAFKLSP